MFSITDQTPPPDDSYRRGATAVYEQLSEASVAAGKLAAEYGKWLLQSLLLLHSGAIAGLATYMANVPSHRTQLAAVLPWFIVGILLTLVAGLVAWVNWSANADAFKRWADPWMIENPDRFPKGPSPRGTLIFGTFCASVILGVLSAACLLGGALHAICVLISAPT